MCYFSCEAPKITISRGVSGFLILGKIQDGGQGGDYCWWRHRPPAAPPPLKYTLSRQEHQRLSTEGEIVSNYCNIAKTPGRGSIPPPLIPRLGYEFACTSEGEESAVIVNFTFSLTSFVCHWTWFVCTYFNEGWRGSRNMMHDPRSMFYSLQCIVVDLFVGGREV